MTRLTIWCDGGTPQADDGPLVLWDAFVPAGSPSTWHSLPDEVHARRDELRAAHLQWIHDIGASRQGVTTLVESLRIRPHLSYWWMTLPADFSLGADSPVYAAVRIMALTGLADRLVATSVRIVASNKDIRNTLVEWASDRGLPATCTTSVKQHDPATRPVAIRARERAYRVAPPLAALRVLARHLPIATRRPLKAPQRAGVLIVDYLAHLAPPEQDPNAFGSNYWGPLVHLLDEHDSQGEAVTYLHLSADAASGAVVDRDIGRVRRLHAASPGPGHDLLHAHLTWRVLASSVRDYARVVRFGLLTRHAGRTARTSQPGALWRAFRGARRDQFYGATAMLNCVWINVFESVLRDLPHQRLGLYLMENQPWEAAFTTAWRQFGHGELIGVIHSTALFWSTRLYRDPRDVWSREGSCPMPWPDAVGVNGESMRTTCLRAGYPSERIVDVEALRYLHLMSDSNSTTERSTRHALVLGEYEAVTSTHLLDLAMRAKRIADPSITIGFRPHPASASIDLRLYPGISLDSHDTLSSALAAADVAVCGSISSAAVDASGRGVTTVLVSDPRTFFTSPAEDRTGTVIIRTAEDLAAILDGAVSRQEVTASGTGFILDASLPLWRALLSPARSNA